MKLRSIWQKDLTDSVFDRTAYLVIQIIKFMYNIFVSQCRLLLICYPSATLHHIELHTLAIVNRSREHTIDYRPTAHKLLADRTAIHSIARVFLDSFFVVRFVATSVI